MPIPHTKQSKLKNFKLFLARNRHGFKGDSYSTFYYAENFVIKFYR